MGRTLGDPERLRVVCPDALEGCLRALDRGVERQILELGRTNERREKR